MTSIDWRVKLGAGLTLAAVAAAAVVVLVVSGPSDADSSTVSHRALAGQVASGLIAAVRLPGSVAPTSAAPENGSALAGLSRASGPLAVERSSDWSVSRSATVVRAFLAAHPPRGTRLSTRAPLTFLPVHAHRGIAAARLTLTVVATGPRSSAVHADSLVRWLVARSPASRIPSSAHELVITRGPQRHRPSLVIDVTAPAQIARIRSVLDRLPVVQPGHVYHCPAQFPEVPVVSFTFHAAGARSRVLAVAGEEADVRSPTTACDALHLAVDGRAQSPLLGGYRLLRQVSGLLGRRLWTAPYAA